jgi:hypothetical protein
MAEFKPNALTFNDCAKRIKDAGGKASFSYKSKISTSRDPAAKAAADHLVVSNVPGGFKKFQLPLFFEKPTHVFVSIGTPDAEVPEHSHDEGDGLRYIVSGSIVYNGQELTAGDWMYIPAGKKYSFRVGSRGVHMFYCYECCCA